MDVILIDRFSHLGDVEINHFIVDNRKELIVRWFNILDGLLILYE